MDERRDTALEMVAHEMSDKGMLRKALTDLVDALNGLIIDPDHRPLDAALAAAHRALDDTSHGGWLRRMCERRQAELAGRAAECERSGHRQVEYAYMEPPRCTYCEQFLP